MFLHYSPMMNHVYSRLSFTNHTVLILGMQHVAQYLQDPTLIHHDDTYSYIDTIVQSLSSTRTVFVIKSPELPNPGNNIPRPKSIIFLSADPNTIVPKLRSWGMWNARSRILVIVEDFLHVHGWIDELWTVTLAADVLVMLLNDIPEYYVWYPYQPNECRKVLSIVTLNNSQIFSRKMTPPFINCSLFAVASPLPPIVVDNNDGMEVRLFFDLAEKLGMNAVFVDLPAGTYVWSLYNESGSPINGMKLLMENTVDLMFGQMSLEDSLTNSDVVGPHFIDEMVWFVPGPKPAPRASAIYRGFPHEIWIGVIITYLVLFVTYTLKTQPEKTDITAGLLVALNFTVNLPHKLSISPTLKFLAIAAYFYSLHISTAYQSSLIIFLSDSPREKPIRNLKDLSETNLRVEFHEGHRPVIEYFAETKPEFMKLKRENRISYTGFLDLAVVETPPEMALLGPKIAFGFSLLQDRYYDEYGHPQVVMLPETVFSAYMAFHLSMGHPLQPLLQITLQHLIEAGMPEYYIRNLSKPNRPRLKHLEPFDIENVIGPFQLYLCLVLLCTIAWIVEWLRHGWYLFKYRNVPDYGTVEWGG